MKDATLGGYLHEHERPPAFAGPDGDFYTVEIIAEPDDAGEGRWYAYLFFLRWRGAQPVGHLESDYLTEGGDEGAVRAELERLTLHEVKAVLDGLARR